MCVCLRGGYILSGAGFDEWSCEITYSDLKAAKFLKFPGF